MQFLKVWELSSPNVRQDNFENTLKSNIGQKLFIVFVNFFLILQMALDQKKNLQRQDTISKYAACPIWPILQNTGAYYRVSQKTVPTLFFANFSAPLGLGIKFYSFLRSPFNGLLKNINNFNSRFKICQEIHNFVQANKNLF